MQEQSTKRDWRDSLITKIGMYAVTAALVPLSVLAYNAADNYSKRKFCEQFGWLRNQPQEIQLTVANREFDKSLFREHLRHYSVEKFIEGVKSCPACN